MSDKQKSLAKYTVLRYFPYPNRDECVSVGLLVFLPDGLIKVHIAGESDLQKVKAINPKADLQEILDLELGIPNFLQMMIERRAVKHHPKDVAKMLSQYITVRPHENLCNFVYKDDNDYFSVVNRIMESLVLPAHTEKPTLKTMEAE